MARTSYRPPSPLCHDEAARAEDTDWPQILALYELLKCMSDNPMVMLNHAIAAAMVHGPSKGLELLKALDSDARLAGHHRLDAVRAHLLEMAGDHETAIKHYRIAAARTTSIPERNYLVTQAARLSKAENLERATWPNRPKFSIFSSHDAHSVFQAPRVRGSDRRPPPHFSPKHRPNRNQRTRKSGNRFPRL